MITIRSCYVRTLLALLICGLTVLPASADDQPIKVFILAGQSNMVGHGKTRDGLNPEYDPSQPQSKTNLREIPGGIGGLAWAVKTMPEVGYMWTHMLRTVKHVLDNLGTEFPEYAGRDYEVAGFGWHQGWNDRTEKGVAEYEINLTDLIKDVRGAFGKELPVVIANTGIGGADVKGVGLELINAQGAVADFEKYPGHKGNVAVVDTRPMYRDKSISPSGFGYHWNHNGITHYEIGAGMGRAMIELLKSKE